MTNVEFILLDCSPLKFSIIAHCDEWQNRFHNLLLDVASTKLSDLCSSLSENSKRLKKPPESLDNLSDSLNLLEHLQGDIPNIEAQFEPLHDQFNILRKYEVQIPEEVERRLEGLQGNWMAFQQCLIDSDTMLRKHKVG